MKTIIQSIFARRASWFKAQFSICLLVMCLPLSLHAQLIQGRPAYALDLNGVTFSYFSSLDVYLSGIVAYYVDLGGADSAVEQGCTLPDPELRPRLFNCLTGGIFSGQTAGNSRGLILIDSSPVSCTSGFYFNDRCLTLTQLPSLQASAAPRGLTGTNLGSLSCLPGTYGGSCLPPVNPKNFTTCTACPCAGDRPSSGNPIDIGSGNKYQLETDYQSSGASPLTFIRRYNARTNLINGKFGKGWNSNFDRSIKLYQTSSLIATANRPDGSILNFTYANNQFSAAADINHKLQITYDTTGLATGYVLTTDDETETYDSNGRLTAIKSRNGRTQTLHYDTAQNLISISDDFGHAITLTYHPAGFVSSMTDPVGNITRYTYDNLQLAAITYADTSVRRYQYHSSLLIRIIDENAKQFATWTYDNQQRALTSEHAGGVERVSLSYGTNSVTVTDALGAIRTYNTTAVNGVFKNASVSQPGGSGCAPASSALTYDANGNIATRTDFNGSVIKYTYDLTRNLETQRIEAFGTAAARTITTAWHATYRLPLSINEPNQRTTFIYDATGNLLSQTLQPTSDATGAAGLNATATGAPRINRWTYNTLGQILTSTGPRNDVTIYTYDAAGNLSTATNSASQVMRYNNYDANGRLLKMTDANNIVTEFNYSPRGWLTLLTVTGASGAVSERTRYDYDAAGQLIKATLPDNSFIAYTYDDAHRLIKLADSLGNQINYTLDALGNRISEQVKDANGNLARQTSRVIDALNRVQQQTGEL